MPEMLEVVVDRGEEVHDVPGVMWRRASLLALLKFLGTRLISVNFIPFNGVRSPTNLQPQSRSDVSGIQRLGHLDQNLLHVTSTLVDVAVRAGLSGQAGISRGFSLRMFHLGTWQNSQQGLDICFCGT
jgi:hypothetical protein